MSHCNSYIQFCDTAIRIVDCDNNSWLNEPKLLFSIALMFLFKIPSQEFCTSEMFQVRTWSPLFDDFVIKCYLYVYICTSIFLISSGSSCETAGFCNKRKQPSRGYLIKRYSENIQQIHRRASMSKCDFNKVALQLSLKSRFGMGVLL